MFNTATSSAGKKTRTDAAQEFLRQELSTGEQPSDDLIRKAQKLDLSRSALFEAKANGHESPEGGFQADGPGACP